MNRTGNALATLHGDRVVAFAGWLEVPGLMHGVAARAALPQPVKRDLFDVVRDLRAAAILPDRITLGGNQVHNDAIAVIHQPLRPGDHPAGFRWDEAIQVGEFPETDALVTDIPGVILVIQTADCLPVFLMDRPTRMVGLAHCGWKGVYADLAGQIARRMIELGARPSRMEAWFGPAICVAQYEVGKDLVDRFRARYPEAEVSPDGLHLDMPAVARLQLETAGLLTEHIFDSAECTRSNTARYHSYRAEGEHAGRMVSYISFTEELV